MVLAIASWNFCDFFALGARTNKQATTAICFRRREMLLGCMMLAYNRAMTRLFVNGSGSG